MTFERGEHQVVAAFVIAIVYRQLTSMCTHIMMYLIVFTSHIAMLLFIERDMYCDVMFLTIQ